MSDEVKKVVDRDEKKAAAEKAKDLMDSYTTTMVSPFMGVAEGEHKYGADAFEEFMAKQGDTDMGKGYVDITSMKKDEKRIIFMRGLSGAESYLKGCDFVYFCLIIILYNIHIYM